MEASKSSRDEKFMHTVLNSFKSADIYSCIFAASLTERSPVKESLPILSVLAIFSPAKVYQLLNHNFNFISPILQEKIFTLFTMADFEPSAFIFLQ